MQTCLQSRSRRAEQAEGGGRAVHADWDEYDLTEREKSSTMGKARLNNSSRTGRKGTKDSNPAGGVGLQEAGGESLEKALVALRDLRLVGRLRRTASRNVGAAGWKRGAKGRAGGVADAGGDSTTSMRGGGGGSGGAGAEVHKDQINSGGCSRQASSTASWRMDGEGAGDLARDHQSEEDDQGAGQLSSQVGVG